MATRAKEKIPAQFRRSVRGWEVPIVLDISNAEWDKFKREHHIRHNKQGRYDIEAIYDVYFGEDNMVTEDVPWKQ